MSSSIAQPAAQPIPQPILRVSDLRQWVYCPRVAFFTLVAPVAKLESRKMAYGREKENRLARLIRRRSVRRFGLSSGTFEANLALYSARLGLSGLLDLLICQGPRRYPVEVKATFGPGRLNHRVQLAGYAILLEDLFGVPVPHGYLVRLPDDEIEQVPIDGHLRDLVHSLLDAARHMIANELFPAANPILARCVDCEYRNFCGDVG